MVKCVQAIPLTAQDLAAITKPFLQLRELNVADVGLTSDEAAGLQAQLPLLTDLFCLPPGQLEEMMAQLDTVPGEDDMPAAGW